MDGQSAVHIMSANNITVHGKSAFVDLNNPTKPSLIKEIDNSGGRTSQLFSTKQGNYFVCNGVVFSIDKSFDLEAAGDRVPKVLSLSKTHTFFPPSATLDGSPYHGDREGDYVILPLDRAAVVLRVEK